MSDSLQTHSSYVTTGLPNISQFQSFYNDSADTNGTETSGMMYPQRPVRVLDERYMSLLTYFSIRKALKLYVNIILGIFGALTNVASLVVLKRDGFWKSSNILLMALTVADLIFTAAKTDMFGAIYYFSEEVGYHFSHDMNVFLFYALNVSYFASNTSYFLSITIPLLIIQERLVAIFFPLKFASIVTPKRTLIVCIVTYAAITSRCIVLFFELDYYYYFGVMKITYSEFLVNNDEYNRLIDATNYITGIGYLLFVIVGTLVIGIKVKHVSNQRKKLAKGSNVGGGKGTSRTTKTLLSVCVIYCVTNTLIYIFDYVRSFYVSQPFGAFFYELNETLSIINSSCNFFVYIYYNRKFRNHLSFRSSKKSQAGRQI